MSILTCHTADCPASGQPVALDLTYTDTEGVTHTADTVICGACGHQITDIA